MWCLVLEHCHVYVYDSYFGEGKGTGRWGTNCVMISFENVHPLSTNRTTQLLQRDMHGRQVEAFHWDDTDTVISPMAHAFFKRKSINHVCVRCRNVSQVSSLLHLEKSSNIFFHLSIWFSHQFKTQKFPPTIAFGKTW